MGHTFSNQTEDGNLRKFYLWIIILPENKKSGSALGKPTFIR